MSSSQLVSSGTPYALVKLEGEELTEKNGGKSVRFWNVYGPEPVVRSLSRFHVWNLISGHQESRY